MFRATLRLTYVTKQHPRSLFVSCIKSTYYDVLGVKRDSSQEEIRASFIEKSKDLHPDSSNQDTHLKFIEINEAYSVLSRIDLRSLYDKELEDATAGGIVVDNHAVNPYRSSAYQSPYPAYNEAWQNADRWTDYHNTYGTSRAKRVAQRGQHLPFWKNFFNHKLEHGGGGPQFASHGPVKRHPLSKQFKFALIMIGVIVIAGFSLICITKDGHFDFDKLKRERTLQILSKISRSNSNQFYDEK
uniref:dnaJ homolog subfamily B member 6 n=1 Tax=Ciona intestinalis TaxID=7719 RepID=UPI0002B8D07A|nr:dnaJ homolog subfamily B member 6 [Ciona intestinalis]|eukprot:XP_004227223.2 dnaJ homolog subfamily B member 6 [Ciona intestinalis]